MKSWTKPQSDAINAKGGSILVSAAAGSGKTAVLVERAIKLLCDRENPVSADKLLVVTFSNAAAAEMKHRMSERISTMIAENPSDIYLQTQQALLQNSQISTIHSFCLDIIRQNFQDLDISPDFILADQNEIDIMEQDCAKICIEKFYQEDSSGEFAKLVELLSNGKDDSRLVDTILKIYKFSRSHPFYQHWLDDKLAMYNNDISVGETVWGKSILKYTVEALQYCQKTMQNAVQLISGDVALEKGYYTPFQTDLEHIKYCLETAVKNDWDATVLRVSQYTAMRLGPVKGEDRAKMMAKLLEIEANQF